IINKKIKPDQYQTTHKEKNTTQALIFTPSKQLLLICLLCSYVTILVTNFFGFATTTINLFFYLIPGCLIVMTIKTYDQKLQEYKAELLIILTRWSIAGGA